MEDLPVIYDGTFFAKKKLAVFVKRSIVDIWKGPKYASKDATLHKTYVQSQQVRQWEGVGSKPQQRYHSCVIQVYHETKLF